MAPGRVIKADRPYEEGSATISDAPQSSLDLPSIFNSRAKHWGAKHAEQDRIIGVYFGDYPVEFEDFFDNLDHNFVINMIRLAWDDLASMAGQEFPLYFPTENETAAQRDKAEKREKVCYGYNSAGRRAGGMDMKGLSHALGWYLVGCAEAVATVDLDYARKTPYFDWRDPRSFYAPVGWSPWQNEELDGSLFARQMTLGELKRLFPSAAGTLDAQYSRRTIPLTTGWGGNAINSTSLGDDDIYCWVGEYYCKDYWLVATMDSDRQVTFIESQQGLDKGHPGLDPTVAYSLFAPDTPRSPLADQVDIQVALSRMFSQKIDFYDRTLYPEIFHTPLTHKNIRRGPNATNELDTSTGVSPFVQVVSPTQTVDANQMMQFTIGMSRILNRNPESMQGGGEADSAKAINELKQAVSGTIRTMFWPTFIQGHPKLYAKAMRCDIRLWGNERKKIAGRTPETHTKKRGIPTSVSYVPNTDLAGHEDDVEIEPGIMLRGYQGRLELLQLLGAKAISRSTMLEQMDVIRDPQEEEKRIEMDELGEVQFAALLAKAQSNELQPDALSKIHDLMAEKGLHRLEAIKEVNERGELYAQPAVDPMAAMMGGGGQDPAAMMASLEAGGGGPPALPPGPPPASLATMRGR